MMVKVAVTLSLSCPLTSSKRFDLPSERETIQFFVSSTAIDLSALMIVPVTVMTSPSFSIPTMPSILPIVMIGVGAGFLLHEIGHKFVSMKYGYWAEFKLWPLGLVIAFVTAFLGFVFAAPGAVNTYADQMSDEINGRISIAGPMTNMGLALVFIIIAALIYPFSIHSQIVHLI